MSGSTEVKTGDGENILLGTTITNHREKQSLKVSIFLVRVSEECHLKLDLNRALNFQRKKGIYYQEISFLILHTIGK